MFEIVPGTGEMAETLSNIARSSKAVWNYPDEWMRVWRSSLIIHPDILVKSTCFVAMNEGRIAGFYLLMAVAGEVGSGRTIRLDHLWVLPAQMRKGIGTALFHHAVQLAREMGFQKMEIESDPNAEGFYLGLGACRVGEALTEVCGKVRRLPVLSYQL